MASGTNAAAGHGAEAAGGAGMPQLDFATFPNQIFWLLVTLVVLYALLSRVVLPRIASILAERQGTISNDLTMAEELKMKAEAAEAAYHEALAKARAEAGKIIAATKAEIEKDLAKATAKADADIAARLAESDKAIGAIRAGALDAVTLVARDTAKELVAALGGGAVDAKSVTAAVSARMKG